MSETKTSENSKERKFLRNEIKYIDSMSDLLAKESGLDKDWIKNILQLTAPRPLIKSNSNDYKAYPARLLYEFKPCLFEAMKWLDKERVTELFSGDLSHLQILETNYTNLLSEIPFMRFESMLPMAKAFQAYLEEEAKNIIKTGDPAKHFEPSYYLETTFLSSFNIRPPDPIFKRPKDDYLKRQKQFSGGLLSQKFLEKVIGSEYYREYIEIQQKPLQIFSLEALKKSDQMKEGLKKALGGILGYKAVANLRHYLAENKLRIPADLNERDETFRANLHLFSQNAFKKFIAVYRSKKEGSLLSEIWKLIYSMPHEHLELMFNGHLGYFGLAEHDFGGKILYAHGRNLLLRILTAAAIADESNGKIMGEIKANLEPIIEDFTDLESGDLKPITYSLYQAIDLCSYDSVMSACGQLDEGKQKLTAIQTSLKRSAEKAIKYSYDRLKALSEQSLLEAYLGRTGGVDDIKTLRSLRDAANIRERFDESYTEYRCLNTAYGIFDFSTPARSTAIEVMFKNYQAGENRTSIRELVYAIYQHLPEKEKEAKLLLKGNSIWRLEKGPLKDHDAVKYGMVRSGAKKFGTRAYILDFSFEDRSPEEQIKILKTKHKERENEIKANYEEKVKKKSEKRNIREVEETAGTRRKFGDMGGSNNRKHKKSK